jgi:hypothetical protein
LMRVTTDDDARICAAAILSLYGSDRVGPGIVSAKEVNVTKPRMAGQAACFGRTNS